jgi:osmotically-inducible protein OsmY
MNAVAFASSQSESAAKDDLVTVRVLHALSQSGYGELRRLHCECHRGTVLLHGTVRSYFMKQMAQATAGRIDGVQRIDNRLRVQEASSLVIV